MDLIQLKLASFVSILGLSLLGGILPIFRINSMSFLSLANCFGGGNFLAIALVHLFVEANEGFAKLGHDYEKSGAYYFLIGLLIPLFVEKVLMKHDAHDAFNEMGKSLLSLYMMLSLLSVHSLIEGIALGVQSHSSSVKAVLLAILAHKFFAAFSLSASIAKSGVKLSWTVSLIVFFSCVTPMGIILGMLLKYSIDSSYFSEATKALAAGTFVYVALVEILLEEFEEHDRANDMILEKEEKPKSVSKNKKFIAALFGSLTAILLSAMLGDIH